MIQLKGMGGEPQELREQREKRLPLAIAAFNAHGHGSKELAETLKGYGVAKEALRQRQHGKCAFCERAEDAFNQPVEHFRPKAAADDFNGTDWGRVTSHYWWLTWTWNNLFFACDDCNRTGRKGNRFPIEVGKTRLPAPTQPLTKLGRAHYAVASESSLLINPRLDDPFDHLEWMPVDRRQPKRAWRWEIAGRTPRGDMTVRAIDLKYRSDEVNRHLRLLLNAWVPVQDAIDERRLTVARRYWGELVRTYLNDREQPYRNAVWWALDSLCPESERKMHGFPALRKPVG